ncbi:hypothetical protein HHK36_014561 [Tetracentron sinense]|uniref:Cytochrome P450 n=1 Tax=Tetracentron sinense TaxID=13715 RepID=A0A835DFX3_TETSI|nr:hypothetical protein HHK36_014561 [Tetracentron sinense]
MENVPISFSYSSCWVVTYVATTCLAVILLTSTHLIASLILFASNFLIPIYISFRIPKKSMQVSLPPGPAPWPVVGNLPEVFRNKPTFKWILGLMDDMNTGIACICLGQVHVIPVTRLEIGRQFLKKQDAVFASRPITMRMEYSSRGFLSIAITPMGEQWKKMSKVVASKVITHARLRWLLNKRMEEANNLVWFVYKLCNTSVDSIINLRVFSWQYSGNVMRKMISNKRFFGEGSKDRGPSVEEEEYVDALFTILSLLYTFCVSDYMLSSTLTFIYICIYQGDNVNVVIGLDLCIVIYSFLYCKLLFWPYMKPMASYWLRAVITLTLLQDLIYASVDNPLNAVEWVLVEMINRPEILKKAVEEIDWVVGRERLVQESDFPELNYIKACAREAFRIHPIAPFNLPHVSNYDAMVLSYFIPKGSHVLLSRVGLGRNPNIWEEPLKFKPERHLKDELANVELAEQELLFITFSTRKRGCIGEELRFAMTIMLLASTSLCSFDDISDQIMMVGPLSWLFFFLERLSLLNDVVLVKEFDI